MALNVGILGTERAVIKRWVAVIIYSTTANCVKGIGCIGDSMLSRPDSCSCNGNAGHSTIRNPEAMRTKWTITLG